MDSNAYKLYQHKHDKDFYNQANAAARAGSIDKKGKFVAEHYLNIYPVSLYNNIINDSFDFHEYTFVRKYKGMEGSEDVMPLLEFKLKFLPFIQKITVDKKPIGRTVINCFAICGGVFAVFSLIEALLGPGLKYLVDIVM